MEQAVRKLKSAELSGAGWLEAPVQHHQLLGSGPHRADGRWTVVRELRPDEDLRPAPDAELVHVRGLPRSLRVSPRDTSTGSADRGHLTRRYNRGLVPAGYLIASAEDMTHYMVSQLNGGQYEGTSVLSSGGIGELHRPAVPTPKEDTSYGMGWFVGPLNDIPVVHHQGETFNFHSNVVLIPQSQKGVVVLMNAENSLDLFTAGRMGTIAAGVASLVEGREPPSPPSNIAIFIVYAALFALLVLQAAALSGRLSRCDAGVSDAAGSAPGGASDSRWC